MPKNNVKNSGVESFNRCTAKLNGLKLGTGYTTPHTYQSYMATNL